MISKIFSICFLRENLLLCVIFAVFLPRRRRYGVKSSLAEGIAPENAPDGESCAEQDPPFSHRLNSIGGAGGIKAARRASFERREDSPVKFNGKKPEFPYCADSFAQYFLQPLHSLSAAAVAFIASAINAFFDG